MISQDMVSGVCLTPPLLATGNLKGLLGFGRFLTGGTELGVCNICVARACADTRHTNDTHDFPQTTLFVVSKSRLIASSARRLLVTEKNVPPHLGPRPFKSA